MIEGFFGVFEIFNSGIFWVGKFGKYIFGWLDLITDFLGIQNNNAAAYVVLRIKHNQIKYNVLYHLMLSGHF